MDILHLIWELNSDMVAIVDVAAFVALFASHDAHTIPCADMVIDDGRLIP